MEFAKAYNVTKLVRENLDKLLSYGGAGYEAIYIAEDTHDMQVYRVIKGYNEDYEEEDGAYLVEREKISKYDVVEKLYEMGVHSVENVNDRCLVDEIFKICGVGDVLLCTLLLDDERGLENWDNRECLSLDEAIDIIDGGFGVIDSWR